MAKVPDDLEEFDRELQDPELRTALDSVTLRRGRNIVRIVGDLVWGQGAVQVVNLLANFFLVHRLSVEAYAQFGLAQGFQNVFSILMDMGFASTIVPLVADKRDDRALVGRYVRAANHLRNRSFAVLAPVAAILFLILVHKHHWSAPVQLTLLASILLSLFFGGTMANFSAPLIIFRRLKDFYLPQAAYGAVRLVAYVSIALTAGLSASVAAALNALYLTASALAVKKRGSRYIQWPEKDSPETDREVLSYIIPASPAIIFSAFQTQITLFLVSVFGGTLFIAQVAALGRIGQGFTLLTTFSFVLVEPYVARLDRARLASRYLGFAALAAVACLPLIWVAFRWPQLYIWVIGSKYAGVNRLLGWYILSQSMNLVSSVIWIMSRSRRWVFWSGSILEVILVLGIQIFFLVLVGVKNTDQAVHFGLAASFGYAIAHGYVGALGFFRQSRKQRTVTA